jgi:2-dehydro-3-deoxyglucarate aldolase/4-hydroxy-2-oxoheptanedioate aldolase
MQAFRARLQAGQFGLCAAVTFADPLVTEAMADAVDLIWIDQEHSPVSPEILQAHLLAARSRGKPTIVRVTAGETAFIKPVLDAGADGIIVPQVRTAAEVQRAVDDCRYPPQGKRGYGPRVPSNYGRSGGPDYVQAANDTIFAAVMIETREAVEAIDEICAIPGLDSIVLGPYDLSGSLGLLGQVEHPTVVAALEHVIARAKAAGKFVGSGMGADAEYCVRMARRGVQWVQAGGDYGYLVSFLDNLSRTVRAQVGGAAAGPAAQPGY